MNKIEIRSRTYHPYGDEKYPEVTEKEIFINNKPVPMGEGPATLYESECEIHGKTFFLYGSNQGGHDGMDVCLKCCVEIQKHIEE